MRSALCLGALLPCDAARLSVRILDENGAACAARVYLRDHSGTAVRPREGIVYHNASQHGAERHFVPRNGRFEVDVEPGRYRIEIERGKEYLPISEDVVVPAAGADRTYRLERWVDMVSAGWYSADMHSHRELEHTEELLEAEDLNLGVPIVRWCAAGPGAPKLMEKAGLEALNRRAGQDGTVRTGSRRWIYPSNEELEDDSAALLAIGLRGTKGQIGFPFETYARSARDRGAVLDAEKPTGEQLPTVAALGLVDTVGITNNHVWRGGCYMAPWGAWPASMPKQRPATCMGYVLSGLDVYYALLNAGLPLNVSAGSASGVHPVPIGYNRTYARIDGSFSAEKWFESVRRGRSFVTNGPMLLLKVDGHEPGDTLRPTRFPARLTVEVTVRSPEPVGAAEVVVNGEPRILQLRRSRTDERTWTGRVQVLVEHTSWIAARWLQERGATVGVAHTSPVHVQRAGSRLRAGRAEIEYLLSRVTGHGEAADAARRYYSRLLEETQQ